MYLRTTSRRNSDGSQVRYLSLALQRVGPRDPPLQRARAVQPRTRGRARPGCHPAPLTFGLLSRALEPGEAPAHRGRPSCASSNSGRSVVPGCSTAGGPGWTPPAILAKALRGRRRIRLPSGGRCDGRQPGQLEAMSKLSCAAWVTGKAGHPRPRRARRGPLLPGDGLAAGGRGRGGRAGLLVGGHAARPRGRPAVLRHHFLHLLRRPRKPPPDPPSQGAGGAPGPTAIPRTIEVTCPRWSSAWP